MARRRPRAISPSPTRHTPLARPIGRREWAAIAGIILLAIVLRFAYPNRMAIEHFDEGVYASNIFFSEAEGGQYPYRHLYAPPLLPFLIEWGMIFLGPESIAPFLPALILGTATVPLAWWAVRSWFGPLAGHAAAWLIATSDFHILYSRTALTDVPVAFFILLAVYLYWEAVRRESLRWSIFAGVATGLAWWTKYTGWLPLAIAFAGSIPWVITEKRGTGVSLRSRVTSIFTCFATMAVVAFVVWSPVLWYLQPYGGYAAVAENHRGYLQPDEWGQNLWEQGGNIAAASGASTTLGVACLAGLMPLLSSWPVSLRIALGIWNALTVGCAVFLIGPAVPLATIALVGITIELLSHLNFAEPMDASGADSSKPKLAAWLVVAWIVGLLVTTPLYHPYPRLMMPWVLAALITATIWAKRRFGAFHNPSLPQSVFAALLLVLPAACFACKSSFSWGHDPWFTARWSVPGWQDRTALRDASLRVAADFNEARRRDRPALLYVYGDPAAFYHLAAAVSEPDAAVLPAGDQSFVYDPLAGVETFALYGSAMFTGHGGPSDSPPIGSRRLRNVRHRSFMASKLLLGDLSGGRHVAMSIPLQLYRVTKP